MIKLLKILTVIALASAIFNALGLNVIQIVTLVLFFGLPLYALLYIAFRTRPLKWTAISFTKRR